MSTMKDFVKFSIGFWLLTLAFIAAGGASFEYFLGRPTLWLGLLIFEVLIFVIGMIVLKSPTTMGCFLLVLVLLLCGAGLWWMVS